MAVAFFLHFVFLLQSASVSFLLHGYFANQTAVWLFVFFPVIVYFYVYLKKKGGYACIQTCVYTSVRVCIYI